MDKLSFQNIQDSMKSFMDRWAEEQKNRIHVTVTPKKVVDETTIKPLFIHDEINTLYECGCEISIQLIDEIKTLPRETLIKDLNAVVYDSIARFEVFYNENGDLEFDFKRNWFPLHALFILRDIQAEESLDVILDFLSQDEELLRFWLGDLLTEDIWSVVAACGKNKLVRLSSFLKETGRYTWSRSAVSEAVNQLALHGIISKQEATDWLGNLVQYYLDNVHVENLIDSDYNGSLVGIFLDLKATELSPLIKQMLDTKIANEMHAGNWEVVKEVLDKPPYEHSKREIESIAKIYTAINNRIEREKLEEEEDFEDDEDFEEGEDFEPLSPYVREKPKLGRNEPCYCGSGRKYKKCHGINE